jgi:glycosyltransferase involved in cell wall biosynthesis
VTVGLGLSDPLGIEASLAIAASFDLFYSQDPHPIPLYAEKGLAVGVCRPAVDPEVYRPMAVGETCDVLFVGKWTAHRDGLAEALAKVCAVRVHTRMGEDRWSVPVLPPLNRPDDLARAYSRARVALEVALVEQPGNPLNGSYRITNRPQFAAACGTPSLIEPYDELIRFFEPGREIAVYNDERELVARALELLSDDRARHAMGDRARQRIVREHTWDRRIRQLLADAEKLLAPA